MAIAAVSTSLATARAVAIKNSTNPARDGSSAGRSSAVAHGVHLGFSAAFTSDSICHTALSRHRGSRSGGDGYGYAARRRNSIARARGTGGQQARGTTLAHHVLSGIVRPAFRLSGVISVDQSSVYTVESDALRNPPGRSSFGILVYATDVLIPAEADAVPDNRYFLVNAGFSGTSGDVLYDLGATPACIGKRTVIGGISTYVFRRPAEGEVVIYVPAQRLLRWEEDHDTGATSWQPYRSMPQRFLDGMSAPAIFDEDAILDFWAMLLGAMQSQWSYDNRVLYDQRDPSKTLLAYLPLLASDYGTRIDADDPEAYQRALARTAVPILKIAGTDDSVVLRLLATGYQSVVHEVWVNPGVAVCRVRADAAGAIGNVAIRYKPGPLPISDVGANIVLVGGMRGGGDNVHAIGYILFRDEFSPADGDTVTIGDGTTSAVFEFDNDATITGGHVSVTIGGTPAITLSNLISAINGSAVAVTANDVTATGNFQAGPPPDQASGVVYPLAHTTDPKGAGTDFITLPHGQRNILPEPPYFPSSRLAIYLAFIDGTPFTSATEDDRLALATALRPILPAHVDARLWGVLLNVNGVAGDGTGGGSNDGEELTLRETFAVTQA